MAEAKKKPKKKESKKEDAQKVIFAPPPEDGIKQIFVEGAIWGTEGKIIKFLPLCITPWVSNNGELVNLLEPKILLLIDEKTAKGIIKNLEKNLKEIEKKDAKKKK